MNLAEYLAQQPMSYLTTCFHELENFRAKGILVDGEIRRINKDFFNNNPTTLYTTVSESIYREISVRYMEGVAANG